MNIRKINSFFLFFIWIAITICCLRSNSGMIEFCLWMIIFVIGIIENSFLISKKITMKNPSSYWLLIIIYIFITTVINYLIEQNYLNSVYQCVIIFLVPYISIKNIISKCDSSFFLNLIKVFISIICLIGVIEYIFKIQPYTNIITNQYALNNYNLYGNVNDAAYSYRTTLIFYHPIFYSALLGGGISIFLYKPYKNKVINYFFCALLFINLILTKSRTGWIIAFIVIFLYLIDVNRKIITKKTILNVVKYLLLSLLLLIVVLIINSSLMSNITSIIVERLTQVSTGVAAGARLANLSLIHLSLKNNGIMNLLIGGGRNFSVNLLANNPQINGWTNAIDNQFLTIFLDYGVIGMLAVLYFYYKIIKVFWNHKSTDDAIISSFILSIAVGSLFFDFLNLNTIYILFLICIVFCDKSLKKG